MSCFNYSSKDNTEFKRCLKYMTFIYFNSKYLHSYIRKRIYFYEKNICIYLETYRFPKKQGIYAFLHKL